MPPFDSTRGEGDASLDAHLLELRARLRQAREQRGGCPPWDELKADLVPGGGGRPGRDERQAHTAICPYCSEHVREWRNSLDFAADRLEAVERGVARGLAQGALGLMRTLGKALPARSDVPAVRKERKAPAEPARALSARDERELAQRNERELAQRNERELAERAAQSVQPMPAPPPPIATYRPPVAQPVREVEVSAPLGRLLVVEMADGRQPPPAVFLCARVLDADVAQVESIEELRGDPDLPLVCGVILGGARPPESWPEAVRQAKDLVPKRPVVLLAAFGVETSPGARRALGDALVSEHAPAERILVALDPDLR